MLFKLFFYCTTKNNCNNYELLRNILKIYGNKINVEIFILNDLTWNLHYDNIIT